MIVDKNIIIHVIITIETGMSVETKPNNNRCADFVLWNG